MQTLKKRDKQVLAADEKFAIKVENLTSHERVDGGTMVLAAISKCKAGEITGIGEYCGFEVQLNKEKSQELQFDVNAVSFERDGSNIRGLARIYLEGCFVINNVSLLQGKKERALCGNAVL